MHVDVRISSGGVRGGAIAFALLDLLHFDRNVLPSWAKHMLYPDSQSEIRVAGVSIGAVLALALACTNRKTVLEKFITMFKKQPLANRLRTHEMLHCHHLCELMLGVGEAPKASNIFEELSTDKNGIFYNSTLDPRYTQIKIAYCKQNYNGEISQHVHEIHNTITEEDMEYLRAAVAVPGLIAKEKEKFDGAYVSSQPVQAVQNSLKVDRKPDAIIIFCCTPLVSTLNFNFFESQKMERHMCTAYRGPQLPQSWQDTIANMQTMAILYDQAAIETTFGIDLMRNHSKDMQNGLFWSKTPATQVPVLFVAPPSYQFKRYASMSMLKPMDTESLSRIQETGRIMAMQIKENGSIPRQIQSV